MSTKRTNKKMLAARILCTLLLGTYLTGGYSGPVQAAGSVNGNEHVEITGSYASAWGYGDTYHPVKATGNYSTAFGVGTEAGGEGSTAFGNYSRAVVFNSTAWGYATQAGQLLYGSNNTAADIVSYVEGGTTKYNIVDAKNPDAVLKGGFSSYYSAYRDDDLQHKGNGATAFGYRTTAIGDNSTAFGYESKASGDNSMAFGKSSNAKADNSLAALGGYVDESAKNSAAIGNGAKVTVADAVALGSGSVADTADTISVGSSSLQRKIVNVAAGTADTDAVNLKQLSDKLDKTEFNTYKEETAWTISTMNGAIAGLDGRVTDAEKAIDNFVDTKANADMDNLTETGKTAVKDLAKGAINVVGDGPVSVAKSDVSGVDTYTVSVKTDGKVEDSNTGIVTGGTVYDYLHGDTVALGKGSEATGTQSIAIGYGNKVSGNNSGAIGDPNTVEGDNSWAFGNNNKIPGNNSIVLGNSNNVSGSNTFVLGSNVTADVDDAIVLGDGSTAEAGAVSVGAKGKERQIKHVADGTEDTDAATVGQLKALAGGTGAGLEEVTRRINDVDSKVNKVGAGAAALAALHPMDTDGKFSMAAGFGNYRDANAMALGVFYRPNDRVMFSMGGSLGNGENMINAGVSFALDKGVSTSKAAMARTIKAQGEKISEQDAKIQTLEAENAKLAERLAAIEAKLAK